MAIDGGMRKQLTAGMRLVASYKKETHTAEVVGGEDGKLRFRLADGREFTSPSAAGSAVMGGIACNGWRFWSLSTDEAETPKAASAKQPRAARAKKAKPEPEAEPNEQAEESRAEPVAAAE